MKQSEASPGMFVTWDPAYARENSDAIFEIVEYDDLRNQWVLRNSAGTHVINGLGGAVLAKRPAWAGLSEVYSPAPDIIDQPEHYTSHPSGIEVIDITRHETFLRGNVLKYVLRAPYKGREVEDLKKAMRYLQWELDRAQREQELAVEEARIPSPPKAAGTPTLPV